MKLCFSANVSDSKTEMKLDEPVHTEKPLRMPRVPKLKSASANSQRSTFACSLSCNDSVEPHAGSPRSKNPAKTLSKVNATADAKAHAIKTLNDNSIVPLLIHSKAVGRNTLLWTSCNSAMPMNGQKATTPLSDQSTLGRKALGRLNKIRLEHIEEKFKTNFQYALNFSQASLVSWEQLNARTAEELQTADDNAVAWALSESLAAYFGEAEQQFRLKPNSVSGGR